MAEISHEKIKETISGYKRLLDIVEDNQDNDSICRLSKKKLSLQYGLSYTGTLKKLSFLLKYGLIEKVDGGFKRTEKDVILHTPLSLLVKILLLVFEKPEVYNSYKQQAEILGESYEDVQSAWGYYAYFFGSKYPEKNEINILKQNRLTRL